MINELILKQIKSVHINELGLWTEKIKNNCNLDQINHRDDIARYIGNYEVSSEIKLDWCKLVLLYSLDGDHKLLNLKK